MSTQYNGNPANTSGNLPALKNISATTNTNPIVVTTTAPHGLTDKDYVDIQGHQTNVTANGVNQISFLSSTTFSIPVAGVAVGGSTGTVQSLALGPTAPYPSDGDDETAVSVDVMLSRLSDQTSLLGLSTGVYKLAQKSIFVYSTLSGNNWAHSTASLTSGNLYQWVTDNVSWAQDVGPQNITLPLAPGNVAPVFAVPGASNGDLVIATLQTSMSVSISTQVSLLLFVTTSIPGVTPPWSAGYPVSPRGVSAILNSDASAVGQVASVTAVGKYLVTGGGNVNIYVQPIILALTTGAQSLALSGDSMLTIDVWRPTGIQQ